ncbi:MAG: GtrA family protein [Eubacteriales bacterium]|nr:GtrA family protein [Eubacteriales bacterium]
MFRYIFVGGCTTLVNFVVFAILCYGTSLGNSDLGITISNVLSIASAILFAYVANKWFVFRSHTNSFGEMIGEMIKFCGARLGTMAIEVGGVYFFHSILHQSPMVGKVLTTVFVLIGNYFISKFLVFRGEKKK